MRKNPKSKHQRNPKLQGVPKVTTIRFESHGQDFIEWDIFDGVVVDSRPFQASIWCGSRVLNEPLNRGDFIRISSAHGKSEIKYAIAAVYPATGIKADGTSAPYTFRELEGILESIKKEAA